ncbi:MAG TPA: GNAT family N-acetyltransferase [Chloroflexota bacterium]|jgi:GNAT superfamily N-acetyltransferase|nr:GNAT family N-acetyltransferase [Chloroflexota bacterium]
MNTAVTATGVTIRPFSADDYAAITRLYNATFEEFSVLDDEFAFEDHKRPAHCCWARWVAERDGDVIGFGQYTQAEGTYHPRKFQLAIIVEPRHQQNGVGGRLYDVVVEALQQLNPLTADEWSREDMACRVGFLERRGFVADMRQWTSALDLTRFEPGAFESAVAVVEAQGIELKCLAELGTADESVHRNLYELWRELRHDVPIPPDDVRAEVSFETWWARNDRPDLLPDAYFVALDGQRYVGTSQLWRSPEPVELRTGLTGVRRAYRRRGIAQALKLKSLAVGKAEGFARAVTENEINNQGMIGINDRLGFVKRPAYVHYLKSWPA